MLVQVDVARLPEITQALYDPNELAQEEATREFRKLLSIERNPPIQQVMGRAGVVWRNIHDCSIDPCQCRWLSLDAVSRSPRVSVFVCVDHKVISNHLKIAGDQCGRSPAFRRISQQMAVPDAAVRGICRFVHERITADSAWTLFVGVLIPCVFPVLYEFYM